MEKFTASNGLWIEQAYGETRIFEPDEEGSTLAAEDFMFAAEMDALREFFLHERDQELGRWRWPEDQGYVVYTTTDPDEFRVVNDATGVSVLVRRSNLSKKEGRVHFEGAAQAYFAAHPEPKPWHEAQDGEIWEVTPFWASPEPRAVVGRAHGAPATFVDPRARLAGIPVTSPEIESARRIYPEGSS